MYHAYLAIALIFNAGANILLKIAAMGRSESIRDLITNPYAVAGVFIFASNVYFYIQALRVLPISLVYPVMTAASFIIINAYGFFMLKEPLTYINIIGYILIIGGILLVTNFR